MGVLKTPLPFTFFFMGIFKLKSKQIRKRGLTKPGRHEWLVEHAAFFDKLTEPDFWRYYDKHGPRVASFKHSEYADEMREMCVKAREELGYSDKTINWDILHGMWHYYQQHIAKKAEVKHPY